LSAFDSKVHENALKWSLFGEEIPHNFWGWAMNTMGMGLRLHLVGTHTLSVPMASFPVPTKIPWLLRFTNYYYASFRFA